MPKVSEQPSALKPYFQHRVDIEYKGGSQAQGECPFCGGGGKFFVGKENGMYSCKSCPAKGNHWTFIRELYKISSRDEVFARLQSELEIIAEERRLDVKTLVAWGLTKSAVDQEWMLPSFAPPKPDGTREVNNLYRWSLAKTKGGTFKRRLMATAELPAAMFGYQFWDQKKPDVFITEGPWDGMKLWETFRKAKLNESKELVRTTDPEKSIYQDCNVLSVPGCETFKEGWEKFLAGKNVMLCYDNDHPRKHPKTGAILPPAGYEGLQKAARRIRTVARSVGILLWGRDGFDPNLPDGFDVRDLLVGAIG